MFQLETHNLHPATLLCLAALQRLHERHSCARVLDLGAGGGILSVVAAEIWRDAEVLAADISGNAVADAIAACKTHGLEDRVKVVRSEGFSHPLLAERAPYDLILCNLLAPLLLAYAPPIKKHLNPTGYAIISGIQAWQAAELEQAYRGLGFEIIEKTEDSPWCAYVLCHKKET